MPKNKTLWTRLQAIELDLADAAFRFSDRLARENGWSREFARGAIEEYRRFIYMAATSPTQVTPSDIVDQVWHLHLTYTRSYWEDMCGGVLGRPLHHGPTKGGTAEDTKYRSQYDRTLALYRETFGEEPPAEFWPPEDARFSGASHQQWVDRRTHFVLPRASVTRAAGAMAAGVGLAVVGAGAAAADVALDKKIEELLLPGGIAVFVAVVALALVSSLSGGKRRRGKAEAGSASGGYVAGCSTMSGGSKGGKDGNGGEGGESGGESSGDGGGSGCGGGGCGGGGD